MKNWLIAGATIIALGLGGAAFATKEMGEATGNKACKTCHVGAPKDKKLNDKVAKHVKDCGATADKCKSCHNGNTKGSKKCK